MFGVTLISTPKDAERRSAVGGSSQNCEIEVREFLFVLHIDVQ